MSSNLAVRRNGAPTPRRGSGRGATLMAGVIAALGMSVLTVGPAAADSHLPPEPVTRAQLQVGDASSSLIGRSVGSVAGSAGWDFVGTREFINGKSGWVRSHGTNFKATVKTTSTGINYLYELWEFDPDNADEYVGYAHLSGAGDIICYSISPWVDGSDGTAEFYLTTKDPNATFVKFYD
ncbi:hypothetical protein [Streptomyces sp. NPDC002913]